MANQHIPIQPPIREQRLATQSARRDQTEVQNTKPQAPAGEPAPTVPSTSAEIDMVAPTVVETANDARINRGNAFVEFPFVAKVAGYEATRVELYSMTTRQSAALDQLTRALRASGNRYQTRMASTSEGLVVDKPQHALMWLLDQMATAIDEETIDG